MNERVEYSESAHDETIGAIEQLFLGRLSKEKADALCEHVLSCDRCERVYERYADAEKALFATSAKAGPLSPFAQDRVAARLFADAPSPKPRVPKLFFTAAFAGAMAVLAMAVLLRPQVGTPPREQFATRGEESRLRPESTLRVLALAGEGDRLEVVDLANGDRTLKAGDRLKLLADSSAEQKFASAVVIAEDGRVLAEIPPQEIGANASDAAVGGSIAVDGSWPKGQVTVVLRLAEVAKAAPKDGRPLDDGKDSVRVLKVPVGEAL